MGVATKLKRPAPILAMLRLLYYQMFFLYLNTIHRQILGLTTSVFSDFPLPFSSQLEGKKIALSYC